MITLDMKCHPALLDYRETGLRQGISRLTKGKENTGKAVYMSVGPPEDEKR